MFKEIGQFNSRHKKPEFLVEVVQSNRRSIPPRIKPNREQGTVREQHALSFLLEFFRREVGEDRARFVPFVHGVWIRRLGSWSSSSQILRIERISCPANFNCEPFLFTLQVDLAPIRMSGLSNRSKKFALVRSTSQLKIFPEEDVSIGRDSCLLVLCLSGRYWYKRSQCRLASLKLPVSSGICWRHLGIFKKNVMISILIPNLAKFSWYSISALTCGSQSILDLPAQPIDASTRISKQRAGDCSNVQCSLEIIGADLIPWAIGCFESLD